MGYELVVIPKNYKKTEVLSCTMCADHLALIDIFDNKNVDPMLKLKHEGEFSICEQCKTPHLRLLSGETIFKNPLLIAWS